MLQLDVADPGVRAAAFVRDTYPDVIDTIGTAGMRAAESWSARSGDGSLPDVSGEWMPVTGTEVRRSFRAALVAANVLHQLPDVLVSTVDELGGVLGAAPVPAPPYVVVTSRGVLLRATLERGRLVVELRAFESSTHGYRPLAEGRVSASLR